MGDIGRVGGRGRLVPSDESGHFVGRQLIRRQKAAAVFQRNGGAFQFDLYTEFREIGAFLVSVFEHRW